MKPQNRNFLAICLTLYIAGTVLYSSLFIFSPNQSSTVQTAKIFVAGAHWLALIIPVYMCQSKVTLIRITGYALILAFFLYAIFLVGFVPYFGFVPEIYTYDLGGASDFINVLDHYFSQLFGWREILLILSAALLMWLISRYEFPARGLFAISVPATLFFVSLSTFGTPSYSEKFGNLTVIRRFGPIGFLYVSISERLRYRDEYLSAETPYPGKIADLAYSERRDAKPFVSPIPHISRVVLVQIESLDPEAIEAEMSGQAIMPFLSKLKSRCLNYTNFFTIKGAGGSSDSEFSVATGLVPSIRLPAMQHTNFARIETLYDRLKAAGVESRFAHNNQSGFYGRHKAYSQIKTVTAQFLAPSVSISESDFAEEALSASLSSAPKVFHYFFNFRSHGPYRGYSDETRERFSLKSTVDIRANYLATMSEVDQMIERLFALQSSSYDRGENLFIVVADHPSQIHTTPDIMSHNRIPALICHTEFTGVDIPNVFSTLDLYPTILEAFGLSQGTQFLGQSMFWDVDNAALLPQRVIIRSDEALGVTSESCGAACDAFFDYTEQHISFHAP